MQTESETGLTGLTTFPNTPDTCPNPANEHGPQTQYGIQLLLKHFEPRREDKKINS